MPGRLRTASRPSKTVIERASYDKVEAPPGNGQAHRADARTPASVCPGAHHYFTWTDRQPQPYVSRGPRLPRTRHSPGLRAAVTGPRTFTRCTDPSPSSTLSRRTSWAASSRSWVAQAVESAATVSSPSVSDSGVVWAASSGPTISAHRPNTEPVAAASVHPWSPIRPSIAAVSGCGSSRRSRRPERPGEPGRAGEPGGPAGRSVPGPAGRAGLFPLARDSALARCSASRASRARSGAACWRPGRCPGRGPFGRRASCPVS